MRDKTTMHVFLAYTDFGKLSVAIFGNLEGFRVAALQHLPASLQRRGAGCAQGQW